VAEIANGTLDAIDLDSGGRQRISGLAEPQGVAYLPGTDLLGGGRWRRWTVRFSRPPRWPGWRYQAGRGRRQCAGGPVKRPDRGRLWRGGNCLDRPGQAHCHSKNRVARASRKLSDRCEKALLYVNLPNAGSLAVVDMAAGTVLARWPRRIG
jgi:hypothetical protein